MTAKQLCPLCGEDNNCGAARGEKDCWCFSVVVPPELLALVKNNEGEQACICLSCLKKYQMAPQKFIQSYSSIDKKMS